jgi:transcriptional antiterminator RfaH
MDFWRETNWFAVQTKPYHESLAAARLRQFDLEVLLPRLQREQYVCGVPRLVSQPLFPGYLFARFCPLVSGEAIRYIPGVLRVVGNRQSPIPVEPQVISSIRDRIQADGFVWIQPRPLEAGEKVTIAHGPFVGWMAEVERELDDGKRVAILLGALQQAHMLIPKRWLEPCPGN